MSTGQRQFWAGSVDERKCVQHEGAVQDDRSVPTVRCVSRDIVSVGARRADFRPDSRLAKLAVVHTAEHHGNQAHHSYTQGRSLTEEDNGPGLSDTVL